MRLGREFEDADAPTAAELIAQRLAEAGCRHSFGIPGGEVLGVMEALDNAGVAFTLCKHENAGGFMAEGSHHVTGAPGVLVATIGPGLINASNVIANAYQDQVPLIVISGCVDEGEAQTYTHQIFDQTAVMRPITKASFRCADGAVDVAVDKAVRIALEAPQGPVHLDLPVSLADRPQRPARRPQSAPSGKIGPAPSSALDQARDLLATAERPIILAGIGAVLHDAGPAIQEIAEMFGAPVVMTYKGKGVLPEDHPLSLGGHGLSPASDEIVLPLLAQSDCIVLAGYDPIEMRHGWRDPWDPKVAIDLAHASTRHGMHGASVTFVGDVAAGLEALKAMDGVQRHTWANGEFTEAKTALAQRFREREAWGPHQAFATARRGAPPETIVTVDSGAHRILISQMWSCYAPRTLLQSSALCTMGAALPLAIGAKIASRDTPVMAVMGDAGLEMCMGELATLRDLKLPLPLMILVDESLALIEAKQRGSQRRNLGVDFPATDFPSVAEAMGGVGRRIEDRESLLRELQASFERETFTLLACIIGRRAYDGAF